MAGRIRREDVEAVRERARIEEIVGAHVSLRPAGVGSMKGLCPFHDERSPSFHVRPQVGRYHCFGCGEGGDVIAFVMKVDGLAFAEAVEYLAGRVGIQLRYEEGGAPRPGDEPGRRRRLLDAHKVAEEFYREQLTTPGAAAGRAFLAERGFDRSAAETFGVGFAPQGWDGLLRHLRGRGFTEAELVASGLVSQGQRGVYDRFRGRLVWPIREVTGETVGFGARRLFDEDQGPKYLNTPETPLYRKSQVLYGIDLAKRDMQREKRVVVVEGYTDVMAMHLSGVGTAVATCGTAFGSDHARIVRRLVGDSGSTGGVQLASGASVGGEIIFTFDGDAAGQKAALRAFGEDQSFSAQTFVAVERSGLDPCELRQAKGPDAVRALVAGRQPLYEFVIRSTLESYDLRTAEGRVGALRAAAPVVAGIRDAALRPEYTRLLAGWLGIDDQDAVRRAVAGARSTGRPGGGRDEGRPDERRGRPDDRRGGRADGRPDDRGAARGGPDVVHVPVARMPVPDRRDPVAQVERTALEVVLQLPEHVPDHFDDLAADAFAAPAYRAVHEAVRAAGGVAAARAAVQAAPGASTAWVDAVVEQAAEPVRALVTELAVAPLPEDRPESLPGYVRDVVLRLVEIGYTRHIADLRGRLQRMDPGADAAGYQAAFAELVALEGRRRTLRESA
ncbi:DNA primase [Cellulomonas fimi]|uniref:DNA primase n=2 Tax=Cellulomonas fimi TaxID=1708 RepID=F4H2T2_CELFA|nr:DNA primase [Cellulomonas fimi]AEE46431.1 DNA primase [Cellulomonas fimi ATCC 484]VEH32969.1 DNA primase [Cellulomonas fimi]